MSSPLPTPSRRTVLFAPLDDVAETSWSAYALDTSSGAALDERDPDQVMATASVGKVLLLITVAGQIVDGTLDPQERQAPIEEDYVEDSGLLQFMSLRELPVVDLCRYVGSVSDNYATNILLRTVGLDAVHAQTARLGLTSTSLNGVVGARRRSSSPYGLSQGSARELAELFRRLAGADGIEPAVASMVRAWMSTNTDQSMVGGGLQLDPLAHFEPELGMMLVNKTGTVKGVRADIGIADGPAASVSYAVIAAWGQGEETVPSRAAVLEAMVEVGVRIRDHIVGQSPAAPPGHPDIGPETASDIAAGIA